MRLGNEATLSIASCPVCDLGMRLLPIASCPVRDQGMIYGIFSCVQDLLSFSVRYKQYYGVEARNMTDYLAMHTTCYCWLIST